MSHPNEAPADFTTQAAFQSISSPMTTVAGTLISLLAGPSLAVASPTRHSWELPAAREAANHALSQAESPAMIAPAAELITRIKEGWQFNMTELAELMDVQRPTLYNWLNGKTSPDAEKYQRLQVIAAAARTWAEQTAGKNLDYILDYTGPQANELTIRDHLKSSGTTADQIRELIPSRIAQYQEAYVQSREILGEPTPVKGDPIRESTRKLNKRWTEHAQRLHRARKSSR